jgi:type II secretory pathway pseudopilin PulG
MKRPNHTNAGFTLVEILVILIITGILAGIAAPSLLSQNKVFKRSVVAIETLIKTTSLSARANSGNPYRMIVLNSTFEGKAKQTLRVEILRNGSCDPNAPLPTNSNWQPDIRKDFDLPEGVVISASGATSNPFPSTSTNGICFNGRGEVFAGGRVFDIFDTQARQESVKATIAISAVGDISRKTYRKDGAPVKNKPTDAGPPEPGLLR